MAARGRQLLLLAVLAGALLALRLRRRAVRARWRRSAAFWARAAPFMLAYKLLQWRCRLRLPLLGIPEAEQDERWAALHHKYAPYVLEVIESMRGIFIKVGQVVSAQRDQFPAPYPSVMESLQDCAPAEPAAVVRRTLRAGLGASWESRLCDLDPEPLGAASIGQAHRARLASSGAAVVIKVQHRDSEALMGMDLGNVRALTRLGSPQFLSLCDEASRQFMLEFDFRREAWALRTIRRNLRGFPMVVVPEPVDGLVSRTVLVMDELRGVKLSDPRALRSRRIKPLLPVLIRCFGHQVLVDGLAHCDPHPGNMFLCDDGRLGLIDFGQVKSLGVQTRVGLARLVRALAAHDSQAVVDEFVALGFRTQHMDAAAIERYAVLTFDRADRAFTGGVTAAEARRRLRERDPVVSFPDELAMIARIVNLLRAACALVGTQLSLAQWWKSVADEALRRHERGEGLKEWSFDAEDW